MADSHLVEALTRQQLASALARFESFRQNIPLSVNEDIVKEYHAIVDAIALATGETQLHIFKIGDGELHSKVVASRPRGFSGTQRSLRHSDKRYVDSARFQRQVDGLANYLERQGHMGQPRRSNNPSTSSPSINIGTMIGSAIQHRTQDSHVAINYDAKGPEFRALLDKIKEALPELGLDSAKANQLHIDIGTIEVQISGAAPNHNIIRESMHSIRSILESAVGSLIASGLLAAIYSYFPK